MKKIYLLLLFVSIFLVGCKQEKIKAITDINQFDKIINEEGVLLYDIRTNDICALGHIPYFLCMGGETKNLEEIAQNIMIVYPSHNKKIVIIGDDSDVLEVFNILVENGYKKLYYFVGGYEKYALEKGDSFVPAVGCDC